MHQGVLKHIVCGEVSSKEETHSEDQRAKRRRWTMLRCVGKYDSLNNNFEDDITKTDQIIDIEGILATANNVRSFVPLKMSRSSIGVDCENISKLTTLSEYRTALEYGEEISSRHFLHR